MPLKTLVVTARKRSLGQGNIFRSVCQEFCPRGGGGALPQCMLGYHTPPGPGTPPRDQAPIPHLDQVPPGTRHPSPTWTRHPPDQAPPSPDQAPSPGPGTPPQGQAPSPRAEHAGRYGQRAGGPHPTEMQSCLNVRHVYFKVSQLGYFLSFRLNSPFLYDYF